ncbi:septum site-determining protein MinC [Vibrio spartinae]|uniref:Probable septum site-determining protein MinC n=1 Tax=Vibrio spartinae TaxID=1918945 RepID=A0A1N6M740_9VIBR|nr:septum site-determining protein MinC [Vibrio spartinae]QMV13986.1 Septum site-determining protein MinC [Vibrio spartinae]SIO95255.1 Septum site-determining protein MinC [Vibrio spartinae]
MSITPDLKGSSFTLSVLHIADSEISKSVEFLKEKVTQAPAFFTAAPIVLNIAQVEGELDFHQLKLGIHETGMVPVGVTGARDKRTQNLASEAGLAVLTASKSPSQAPAAIAPTKTITTPIRSGQQVYAKNSDLVILNHVSAGAEVIADGSIHIYGSLRGRAIAGASGQQQAKIFCHDLQAELISIAGNYWLSDQISSEHWQTKAMLSYHDGTLHIEPITI